MRIYLPPKAGFSKIGSVFPHSFNVIVSITVLVVIIVGGLASVPGVVLASFVLVGLPELLREFEEYRFLIYGALLIFMMQRRPEGFIRAGGGPRSCTRRRSRKTPGCEPRPRCGRKPARPGTAAARQAD